MDDRIQMSTDLSVSHADAATKRKVKSQDARYRGYSEVIRQQDRMHDEYLVTKPSDIDAQTQRRVDRRTSYMKSNKLASIRDAILSVFRSRPYEKYDRITGSAADSDERKVTLHHALGTHCFLGGDDVLEIDCAGSEFQQFRKEHTGFHGQGEVIDDRLEKVYGKLKSFRSGNNEVPCFVKHRVNRQTGNELVRVALSGPGKTNTGKYQIDNVRRYIFDIGRAYILRVINRANGNLQKNIVINLQGHSRGAVSVSNGAAMLAEWIHNTPAVSPFENKIKINVIQHDAVPGFGSMRGIHGTIDLRSNSGTQYSANGILGRDRVRASGSAQINTTSIVSLHSDRSDTLFIPQNVRGQRRIILMAEKHGVGLDQADTTQTDILGKQKLHRKAGIDARTGDAYRGSGYSELDSGVYFQDENGALVRMNSYADAMEVLRKVTKNASGQGKRREIIDNMVKNWFIDNRHLVTKTGDADFVTMSTDARRIEQDLLASKWRSRDSDEMKAVKSAISNMRAAFDGKCLDAQSFANKVTELETKYNTVMTNCMIYMEKRQPSSDSGKKRLEMVSRLLTAYRTEFEVVINKLKAMQYNHYQGLNNPDFKDLMTWYNS